MSEDSGSTSSDSMELPPVAMQEMNLQANGPLSFQNGFRNSSAPYSEIVEQPQQRGFRFRYRCEGPSHGGLQGEHSERGNKTYPAIKIHNYSGPAVVMVTLVTDEKMPRTHAHELMGKHCQNGICVVNVPDSPGPDTIVMFPNLGILHVTKKKVESILRERIIESMKRHHHLQTSNYEEPLPDIKDELKDIATKQAKEDSKKMHLNVVRLKFQVYLPDRNGNYSRMLEAVVSNTVYDSKCPGVAGLNICRMDRNAGCSTGHEEVFLLCDKVQKDDILVRFFEKDEDDQVKWEAFGNFGPSDVHRQYAIVFKTPPYQDPNITSPVQVSVQLRRISDHETSEPKPFTYFPQQLDKDEVGKKRKKALPFDTRRRTDTFFPNSQPGTGGSGFCPLGGSDGTNNTGTTTNGGRVNSYGFVPDLLGCASGPRMEMQSNDAQMAASGVIMHQTPCLQQQQQMQQQMPQPMAMPNQQQMFTKLQMADQQSQLQQVLNSQPHVIKPMEINPTTTSPTPEPTLEELTTFLATCNPEALLTQTGPLSVTTPSEQKVMIPQQQVQMGQQQQQQMYRQQPMQQQQQQFLQQQMQPGFQQQMANQMVQQNQAQMATGQMAPQQFSPSQQQQQQIQQQPHYAPQGQQQSPYSPGQAQYSPASQQAYSPGAQPCYSPGSTHSFSPGAQQQQQQQQQFSPQSGQQFSPNSQTTFSPTHQQPSPPSVPYVYQEVDLLIDGPDNEKGPTISAPITDMSNDVVCDSTEFEDPDLEEDAVPMNPTDSRTLVENFHRRYSPKPSDAEALIIDLEKLSLKKPANEDNKEAKEKDTNDGEENTEKTKPVETPVVQENKQSVLDLDLHLALNVAKRSIVALHNYSKTGDPVYLMLCQRHLISVQDDLGDTALHMAIIHRQTEVAVKLLQAISTLKNAASEIVNSLNILRQTPLQLAVITRQPHLVPLLLAQHADPHLVDREGNTPLHLAARLGHTDCVTGLLQAEKGCPRTLHKQFEALNYEGFSALHLAIIHGHFECMRQMVERGADVNQRDGRSGRTALHHAVEADNHAMAGYILLKTEVDVNAFAYDRTTALHMAVGRRLYAMAKLLVDSDANPEAESSEVISAEYEDDIVEDSDDAVDDGDDTTEGSESCDYVRPIDLAQGDDKMLRILNQDDQDLGFEDSKVNGNDNEGDISRLDQLTLQALADKLDAVSGQPAVSGQAGWQALANRLGLMSAMDRFRDQPSPTLHLLDTYKAERGTVKELRRVLTDMKRYDAAALVDKFITTPKQTERDPSSKLRPEINDLSKLHLTGSECIDLGYRSSSLGSFS